MIPEWCLVIAVLIWLPIANYISKFIEEKAKEMATKKSQRRTYVRQEDEGRKNEKDISEN